MRFCGHENIFILLKVLSTNLAFIHGLCLQQLSCNVLREIFYFSHTFYIYYIKFFWLILEIFIIWNTSIVIICPFSPMCLFFDHLYQCWFMNIYFILWIFDPILSFFILSTCFSFALSNFFRLSSVSFRHSPTSDGIILPQL